MRIDCPFATYYRDTSAGLTVMNDLGSQPADGGMMMRGVVPGEELLAETPGVLD
jgi:hypothetical protein